MRVIVPILSLLIFLSLDCAAEVDYLAEVKPLFLKNCTQCNGEFQQKSGLRLDTAKGALKGGSSGQAILPKNAKGSLLIQVLEGRHSNLPAMPYKKPALSLKQLATIKSVGDLADARRSMKQEMLNLRIQQKSGQLENPARIRVLRRSVARIETVINELAAKKAAAAK